MSVTLPAIAPTRSDATARDDRADAAATLLEQRRARRRAMRQVIRLTLALVAIAGLGYLALARTGLGRLTRGSSLSGPALDASFHPVTRTRLPILVTAPGDLESSQNIDVASQVEGSTMILFVKPEGSPVKKGDLVCELDSGALRDSLTDQSIVVQQAESAYKQAIKTREVAESAVKEYIDGTYPASEQTMLTTVRIAQTQLGNSQMKVDWSDRMLKIGYATDSQNRADHLTYQRDELSLRGANTSLSVLRKYTRQKTLTSLEASVDSARSAELSSQAVYRLQKAKEEKLRKQVDLCRILAPADGLVIYANEQQSRRGPSSQTSSLIEEGASVRERQAIFRLPDIQKMRVATRIQEATVSKVRAGQKAHITIDAIPGQVFQGTVRHVRPLVDSRLAAENDIRIYTADVSIDNPSDALRPGMTGEVEILVDQTDDVLAVPVTSVLQFEGASFVYVAGPKGPERRKVELGASNDKLIAIRSGVQENELVAKSPKSFLSEQDRQRVFILSAIETTDENDWDQILARTPSPGLTTTP